MADRTTDQDTFASRSYAGGAYPYAEPGPSEGDGGVSQPEWQEQVTEWIRENQTLAMVLGFAAGVFLGVMMRD